MTHFSHFLGSCGILTFDITFTLRVAFCSPEVKVCEGIIFFSQNNTDLPTPCCRLQMVNRSEIDNNLQLATEMYTRILVELVATILYILMKIAALSCEILQK